MPDLDAFLLLPFAAIVVTVSPVLYRDCGADHVVELTPTVALVPPVYPGVGLLTIRCLFECFLSSDGE